MIFTVWYSLRVAGSHSQRKCFQKMLLKALLLRHESLFGGIFGEWKGEPIDIKLKEGSKPYYCPSMKVPHIHESTTYS